MNKKYSHVIAPFIETEIALASKARDCGDINAEFKHLENIHVVGQVSTYWHVKTHALMLLWAFRNYKVKEAFGQIFRIVGAATKTSVGLVPQGNTGGANVSPFKAMPISAELQSTITTAKSEILEPNHDY